MFLVTKEIEFDAAHRVANHKSKCRNLHGHRYKVVACCAVEELEEDGSSEGMVVDFGDLKKVMMEQIHDVFDHGAIFQDSDIWFGIRRHQDSVDMMIPKQAGMNIYWWNEVPTAENMAKRFYYWIAQGLSELGFAGTLQWVDVYETPTSVARYVGLVT